MSFWYLLGSQAENAGLGGGIFGKILLFSETGDSVAINEIAKFLNLYLVPFTVILCVAGAIMAIVLGAAMVRAEDLKKADDYKRKLVGLIVTIVIVIVLVWLTGWLLTSYKTITDFFKEALNF